MDLVNLGSRIKYIRKYLQLLPADFAAYLGADEALLKSVEEGSTAVSTSLLTAMLHKLDVSTDWLLTGTGPMFLFLQKNIPEREKALTSPVSIRYFSLKEKALESRIRELEQSIITEANIPLQNLRVLFSHLLKSSVPESAAVFSFSKLAELSYENKVLYFRELEKHFKSARAEFFTNFKHLCQTLNQQRLSPSEPNQTGLETDQEPKF